MIKGKSVGYARVSTRGQAECGHSLGAQARALTEAGCDEVMEEQCSGKIPSQKRPVLSQLLAELEKGDTLVTTRVDRLGRSTLDIAGVVDELEKRGVSVRFLDANIDTSTASGKAMLNLLALLAELERGLLSERTREGLAEAVVKAREQGRTLKLGRPQRLKPGARDAVLERLARGDAVRAVARDFGVSPSTIRRLRDGMGQTVTQLAGERTLPLLG